jgi:hypothetical protein
VLHVWLTTAAAQFVQQSDVVIGADGTFTIFMAPDSMATVTTLTGQAKGSFPDPIPAPTVFPVPYADDFNSYAYDAMARYFADQGGSFAVRNGSLVQVVPVDPGPNGWVADADPITFVGDLAWADINVTVTAAFSDASPAAAEAAAARAVDGATTATVGELEAGLLPCDATVAQQVWRFDTPAAGYLSNDGPAGAQCLNVWGCGTGVAYYACVTTGGTCCGANCYTNLQWALNAAGQLVSALNGDCVTVQAGTGALVVAACGAPAPAAQTWVYNATSGQLRLAGTGMCLSTPVPLAYVQLCGRISTYDGFRGPQAPAGYCLSLYANGTWVARAGTSWLASGSLPALDPSQPHALSLAMVRTSVSGAIAGASPYPLFAVTDTTYAAGFVAIGSGYHAAAFDDFAVVAQPSDG